MPPPPPLPFRFLHPTHLRLPLSTRLFTTSLQENLTSSNPRANQPDSPLSKSVRTTTPNIDQQSGVSADEHKSGSSHPAKQPDHQEQPDRTTGIGGTQGVQGGEEGLDAREEEGQGSRTVGEKRD